MTEACLSAGNNKSWLTPMTVGRIILVTPHLVGGPRECPRCRGPSRSKCSGCPGTRCHQPRRDTGSWVSILSQRGDRGKSSCCYHGTKPSSHGCLSAYCKMVCSPYFLFHGNALVFVCSLKYSSWLLSEELSVWESDCFFIYLFFWYILSCQWFLHNWLSVFLGLRSTLRPGEEERSPARCAHAQVEMPWVALDGAQSKLLTRVRITYPEQRAA